MIRFSLRRSTAAGVCVAALLSAVVAVPAGAAPQAAPELCTSGNFRATAAGQDDQGRTLPSGQVATQGTFDPGPFGGFYKTSGTIEWSNLTTGQHGQVHQENAPYGIFASPLITGAGTVRITYTADAVHGPFDSLHTHAHCGGTVTVR